MSDQRQIRKSRNRAIGLISVLDDSFRPTRDSKKSHKKKQSRSSEQGTESIETISTIDAEPFFNLRRGQVEKFTENQPWYNTVELKEVAKIADRYSLSDRAAAAVCTAALIDFGIVTDDNKHFVVDKSKIRRHRIKIRTNQVQELVHDDIRGLYFDGRKDTTKIYTDKTMKTMKEEHISFVQEPGSLFIGHKAIESGKADSIVSAIEMLLNEKSIPKDNIDSAGSDGTNVNTGEDNGVIRKLELKWNRPLQWIICQLHSNELPLRALLTKLDGNTTGPKTYSGPIGKRLPDVEQKPIANFEPITFQCLVNLEKIAQNLSTDQKYLFDICTGISNGKVSKELGIRSPGTLSMARWVVTANRILRLYISYRNPSVNLKTMARFVIEVYAPVMFEIKYKSSVVYGSLHLAKMIKLSRTLPRNFLDIVQGSIQRNGYYAHPEHVIMAMANDDDENIRRMAWLKVLAARSEENCNKPLRKFMVPKINFECDNYTSMIDIPAAVDPPMLRDVNVTQSNIEFLASTPILEHEFGETIRNMPVHTQAVERCVKLVTEASKSVCGENSRDGHIANTLASRNIMKRFDSKSDYSITKETSNKLQL